MRRHILATAVLLAALAGLARAGSALVRFPENFEAGVHHTTENRGDIRQDIYSSREAIDAVKNSQLLPSGTVITLVDSRSGKVFCVVVMEKCTGWGAAYPPEKRIGEWEFQAFNAEGL